MLMLLAETWLTEKVQERDINKQRKKTKETNSVRRFS